MISLRVLVALLGGFAALIVAATVLSVAATTFSSAARETGTSYIMSTLRTTASLLEDYFNRPVRDVEMIATAYASYPPEARIMLPSDDGSMDASNTKLCEPMRIAQLQNNGSVGYSNVGLFFDDGSIVALPAFNRTDPILTPSGVIGTPILSCFMVSSYPARFGGTAGMYSDFTFFSQTLEIVPP